MGPLRRKSASPLLGKGIFTADNEVWSHQRTLIRPGFVRAQVAEFSIFEVYLDQLIQLIKPSDGVVDLQQLFTCMVLDSNSEHLFRESVGLLNDSGSESAKTFHDALDCAQQGTMLRLRLGNFMFSHRDAKFRDASNTVNGYADKFVTQALQYREEEKCDGSGDKKRTKYVFLQELAKDTL